MTTKAASKDAIKGADAALRYLHCVQATIDEPAYPAIRKAFTFPEERTRRRGPGQRSAAGSLSPEPGGDIERIAGLAANAQSLWYRAEDFWHIVGWAFNCSVAHKTRWDRWKLWLGTMLDFLEADWDVCVKQSNKDQPRQEAILRESLLWHYIVGDAESTNRGMRRRIVKAILSVATPESRKEFPEVWDKETAEPRRQQDGHQKVGEVDFETGDVADYDSDEEMQDAPEQTDADDESETSSILGDTSIYGMYEAAERLGGQDAIELRQRLVALASGVSK